MTASLSSAFRPADILYQQPVAAFAAWLSRLPESAEASAGAGLQEEQASAIASRLLLLPISSRRAVLSAMMDDAVWSTLAPSEESRRRFLALSSRALQEALSKAPLDGAMWLAAAKLRTLQEGFDRTAETFLRRSYVLAPREAMVAADRLAFAGLIRPLARENIDSEFQRDSDIVCQTRPKRYRALKEFLALPDCNRS